MTTPKTAEDILSAYKPENKPIEITLPDGSVMTFRPIVSSAERRALVDKVAAFMNAMPERGTKEFKAHLLADVWPKSVEDQSLSLILHFRAIDPPLSQITACQYHEAPELVSWIESRLATADKEIGAMMREKILEAARKKSKTPGNEDGSPLASEPFQGETPTI